MDFIWNDGGRAACGFVGLAGDCVTRAISIATGVVYRDVYEQLGVLCEKSPRSGVRIDVANKYLTERNWQRQSVFDQAFDLQVLPMGKVIVHLSKWNDRSPHFCTVIDRVVHDTWDASEDGDYFIHAFWTSAEHQTESPVPGMESKGRESAEQELTQSEFDKILNRLRALDNTASNGASTEAEKHNALRMMQTLMLRHNLSRDDITDDDNVSSVQFTRIACPVNGRRACNWEKSLAHYVTADILPSTQWFSSTKGHRTLFWFYGPLADVRNAISLFRELLLTIATAAQLQFRGYSRGSGASYAEGYVLGLPRTASASPAESNSTQIVSERALIQTRTIALQTAAEQWLKIECNITLVSTRGTGRFLHDDVAANRGKLHGSQHEVTIPNAPRRITQK